MVVKGVSVLEKELRCVEESRCDSKVAREAMRKIRLGT
jgi:hypothetical protein